MDVGLCYSGGKDSTLAGMLLEPFCGVTALCCTFGISEDYRHALESAEAVGFETAVVELDESVAREATDRMLADGYPRAGIQLVHEHALETAAALDYDAIADGTRRDDRVPTVDTATARSLEDRYDVDYVAPLMGYGRGAIDRLVQTHLHVETGPSESVASSDYEGELRRLVADAEDPAAVDRIFPDHTQSRVLGRTG